MLRSRYTFACRALGVLLAASPVCSALPFLEDFESGSFSSYWTSVSTSGGRIAITNDGVPYEGLRHVIMESTNGTYARNELTLTVDLAGFTNVILDCWATPYWDEENLMPVQFTGSTNADGIALSVDGSTWHRLSRLSYIADASATNIVVDLSAFAASRGLVLGNSSRIRFQQYDNFELGTDGWSFDQIQLYEGAQAADVRLQVSTTGDPLALGSNLTYTIVVSNAGPASAASVVLSNQLPAAAQLLSASGTQGTWVTNGLNMTAALGTLAPGAQATFVVVVLPTNTGYVVHTAQATTTAFDPQRANNRVVTATLIDVEGGTLDLAAASYAVDESQGGVQVTVERTAHVAGSVSFDVQLIDGGATSGVDYVAGASQRTLTNGVTTLTWTIPLVDDQIAEGEESFTLRIANATGGAVLGSVTSAVIAIRDEDGAAALPFEEGFESGVFSNYWRRYSPDPGGPVITTADGPHSGARHVAMDEFDLDYTLGELVLTVDLAGQEGVYLRFWHKSLYYELHNPMPASFAGHYYADGVAVSVDGTQWFRAHDLHPSATGTNEYRLFDVPLDPILAAHGLSYTNRFRIKFQQYSYHYPPYYGRLFDDVAVYKKNGNFRFRAPETEAPESVGVVTLVVDRVEGDSGAVSVSYLTRNGSAAAGADYSASTGTLFFANGESSRTFAVAVAQDGDDEAVEVFYAELSNPAGGAGLASPTQSVVRILDDDGPGEISFRQAQYAEQEDGGLASITVDRRFGREGAVSVAYRTQSGSATAGVDYVETTGTLSFADGAGEAVFEIPLLDDALVEGAETVQLFLQDPMHGAALGTPTNATLVIADNEAPRAAFPFYEGFEAPALSNYWAIQSTAGGRIQFPNFTNGFEGSQSLNMDAVAGAARNEAILTIDLAGQTSAIFRVWTRDFTDAPHPMPAFFSGSTNADGIALSTDGLNWHRLVALSSNSSQAAYTNFIVDLAAFAAQRGLVFSPATQIKFQQYDSGSYPARGRSFDHLSIAPLSAGAPQHIRFQGFEGAAADTWDFRSVPRAAQIAIRSERQYGGTRSLRLRDASNLNGDPAIVFENVDISAYNNVYFSVAFSASGPDTDDDLFLDLSYDNGATWSGAGSVKLVDGFSNAEIPFGETRVSNPTTVTNNPWTVFLPPGQTQVRARLRFDENAGTSAALDSYFVDQVTLGYLATNQPPQLAALGDQLALVSNRLAFTVSATDVDHDVVTLSASNLPPGATFDTYAAAAPVSNVFEFVPDLSQTDQVYAITFRAADDDGHDDHVVTLRVRDKVVTLSPAQVLAAEGGLTQTLSIVLSRPADMVVHLSATGTAVLGAAGDFTLSATTLVFSAAGPGEQSVTVAAVDDGWSEGVESAQLRIADSPDVAAESAPCAITIIDNDSISIVSANLTSGGSFYYTGPGQRILQALQPDIAAIQEFNVVEAGGHRAFVDANFGTGFSYFVENSGSLPNGIVSRWPILAAGEWEDPQVSDRDFVWATIDVPGGRALHVVCVHLHYSGGSASREIEARLLTNFVAQAGFHPSDYVVLCGDLNTQNRSEAALQVLTTMFPDTRQPADQLGDTDTNQNRDKPYDFVLPMPYLNARHQPVFFGGQLFPEGLVFDTRRWDSQQLPAPALVSDSADFKMQHMAVKKQFSLDSYVTVLTEAGAGGTVSPQNPEVGLGSNQSFAITAAPFFHIQTLATNGAAWVPPGLPAEMVWTWSNAQANGWLEISFAESLATNNVPQRWLARYQLTNEAWDLAALADQDADGVPTWQEYLADTDPTNAQSVFKLTSVQGALPRWVSFAASTARVYTVRYQDAPSWTGAWHVLAANLPGSNTLVTVADTNASAFRIYRVDTAAP